MGSLIHMIILNIGNTTCQNCSASATLDDTEIPDIMNQNDKSFDEVDLTERIVIVVGKTLALAYCVGLVMIVMYYCYVMPRSGGNVTVSISCRQPRRRRQEGREGRSRYKDQPPSYESIHLSDLPPHYEDATSTETTETDTYQKTEHFSQTIIHWLKGLNNVHNIL